MIDKYDVGAASSGIATVVVSSLDNIEQWVRVGGGAAFLVFMIISIYFKCKKNKNEKTDI